MSAPVFKKVCLLGDFAVGKTSLVRRVVDNQFSDEYLSTIGVKISRKLMQVATATSGTMSVQVVLWDLEGKENFDNVAGSYLKGASGAIIVCDVTRPATVTTLQGHIKRFLSFNPAAPVVVAYNKIDLLAEQEIRDVAAIRREGQVIAAERTSARTGSGVDTLFETLCLKMRE